MQSVWTNLELHWQLNHICQIQKPELGLRVWAWNIDWHPEIHVRTNSQMLWLIDKWSCRTSLCPWSCCPMINPCLNPDFYLNSLFPTDKYLHSSFCKIHVVWEKWLPWQINVQYWDSWKAQLWSFSFFGHWISSQILSLSCLDFWKFQMSVSTPLSITLADPHTLQKRICKTVKPKPNAWQSSYLDCEKLRERL